MERSFRTFFFRVAVNGARITFQDILAQIFRQDAEERTISIRESPARLIHLQQQGQTIEGDLERVQMGNFPNLSRIGGDSEDLDLDEDEGLGHRSAFIYLPTRKVLAIQNNITGVGAKRFEDYVNAMLDRSRSRATVAFSPIIVNEASAERALAGHMAVRKLVFTVTDPNAVAESLAHLGRQQPIASTILESVSDAAPVNITISLSVGRHTTRALRWNFVSRLIRQLRGASNEGEDVSKIVARGEFDGENTELNFLPYKLFDLDTIDVRHETVPVSKRLRFVRSALERKRPIINEMFRAE